MIYRREGQIRRLERLKEYVHDLKEIKVDSFEEYLKDKKTRYSVERLLFLIAQGILDFLDHILSSRHQVVSDTYEEILENAYKHDVISKELYSKLKGLGSFRNILAHEYLRISDEEIFRNYQKMLEIMDEVIEEFEETL